MVIVKLCGSVYKKKQKQTLYCDGVLVPLCFACDVRDSDFSLLVRFYNNTSPLHENYGDFRLVTDVNV